MVHDGRKILVQAHELVVVMVSLDDAMEDVKTHHIMCVTNLVIVLEILVWT